MSNIFDGEPPGGLWDDELEPAQSAAPRLRAVDTVTDPPRSQLPHKRPWPTESVVDLTRRRESGRAGRRQRRERRGRSLRAYVLVGLAGVAATVGAVTTIGGTSGKGKVPPHHVPIPDVERLAATRAVTSRNPAALTELPASLRSTRQAKPQSRRPSGRDRRRRSAPKATAQASGPSRASSPTTTTATGVQEPAVPRATTARSSVTTSNASSTRSEFGFERCEFPPC